MFTRCPDCHKTQPLTVAQLREGRGLLRCSECAVTFDALIFLSESDHIEPIEPAEEVSWSEAREDKPLKTYWRVGVVLGLLLLAAQFVYFEGYHLSQRSGVRLWLEKISDPLGLSLPVYRNRNEFEVLHRSLAPDGDQQYVFKIVFSNQAAFRQPYPNIDLTLLDFAGIPFAHRILRPEDYLGGDARSPMIESNATLEISLKIGETKRKVGGFDFEFTD